MEGGAEMKLKELRVIDWDKFDSTEFIKKYGKRDTVIICQYCAKQLTLKEIAEYHDLTVERIRQILTSRSRRIKYYMKEAQK
jgi:DNA-directed RNA polymerase sigma subunit (sigma70/sigma32)